MGKEDKKPLETVKAPDDQAEPKVDPEAPKVALAKGAEQVSGKAEEALRKLEDANGRALTLEGKEVTPLDLSKLSVESLIKLEDQYPGILLYTFTDIIGEKEKIDFSKWEFYKKPVAGQELKIDFRGNEAANEEIGAADILPPSVRCITVYEDGDKALARTSQRRLGLKGRNRSSETIGFFDKEGYIPIYTGDVIVVGGAGKESAKGIDFNYEKHFLTKKKDAASGKEEDVLDEGSYAKYEQSEEAKKDQEFLGTLLKENPHAATRKGMTEEDIAAMEARNTATGINSNIVKAILMVVRNGGKMGINASCCWDWANKIYRMAGVTGKWPAKGVFSYATKYPGSKNCKIPGGGPGITYATEAQYNMVQPGDWIFYNNRNTADRHGNHSAIFIEWLDRDRKIARLGSGNAGREFRLHTADLSDKPLIHLGKPAKVKPALPDIAAIEAKYRQDRVPPTLA